MMATEITLIARVVTRYIDMHDAFMVALTPGDFRRQAQEIFAEWLAMTARSAELTPEENDAEDWSINYVRILHTGKPDRCVVHMTASPYRGEVVHFCWSAPR